jgi:hypothetical protein
MPDVYGSWPLHLPLAWLAPLATSELRLVIYGNRPLYGALRFLHLIGVAGFFGFVALIELRRLGLFASAALPRQPMLMLMNASLALTLLSGAGLFLYDPIGTGLHRMFLPKLLLIALGLALAYGMPRIAVLRKRPGFKQTTAAAALAAWTLVIACSVWNQVERPLNPADVHRADPRNE